jgi:ABC-type nitrate/sulfonate/bicarbonate transport system substrate-binding protein
MEIRMTIVEKIRPQSTDGLTEVLYTICPVLNASNVAVELGWLDEELARVGARGVYLPDNAGWIPHYTHGFPNLIRDGGAIPTIQAKADLTPTRLFGLTWAQTGGEIVVRAGSGLHRVADLRGRRIGLFKSLNRDKIDFQRATAERGIELALGLAGLGRSDVEIVDIESADDHRPPSAARPAELWAGLRDDFDGAEVRALSEGRVDAIHSSGGRSLKLVESGRFVVIEDFARHPDWTLQVANGPYTAAINADFAERHPEVPIAFLRAAIRAGRWINQHRGAAADIFRRVTFYSSTRQIERAIADFDFVPNLSEKNLAAIEIQKDFLISHGYVQRDFAVSEWADRRFLEEALRNP